MDGEKGFPFLITKNLDPENQETPIHFVDKWQTPIPYFFRRNHFTYPLFTPFNFWIHISGQVTKQRSFHYYDILSLPTKSLLVPLECAGNKRSHFHPNVYGEQWEEGAISQGKWTGVSLKDLIQLVGLSPNAKEIVFEGADFGKQPGITDTIPFERSLPIEKALHPDTILAFQYNDKPLTFKHGYPFRLIVPNWYAMASVKWLKNIKVVDRDFKGHFQTNDYVYYPHENNNNDSTPVTTINVNSIIQKPLHLSILKRGTHEIKGIAWTGKGIITELQLSFDKGNTWVAATLNQQQPQHSYAWSRWSYHWKVDKKGEYTIYARAKDSHGRIQPIDAFWNRKGYGYNAVSKISIKVE